jgi:hypothetical protein
VSRPRYTDRYDDPLYDREDEKYGDYENELHGFTVYAAREEDDDDDNG